MFTLQLPVLRQSPNTGHNGHITNKNYTINILTENGIWLIIIPMDDKNEFKSLEISGAELDRFVKTLVDRLYRQIWSDLSIGNDEVIIKERLQKSIIAALEEYAGYCADDK